LYNTFENTGKIINIAYSTAMWAASGWSVSTSINHSHGFQHHILMPKEQLLYIW